MTVKKQIAEFIASQPQGKGSDIQALHDLILQIMPSAKLWFLDGRNEKGKVVSNPNIGYGSLSMKYRDGSARDFYQIGLTATSAGISIYIMGIEDKKYMAEHFAKTLGKASVTGYCIRFRALKDIDVDVLGSAIRFGFEERR